PLPPVLVGHLRRGHGVPLAGTLEDRLDDGPFGLERAAVGQVEVDLQNAYVRGISRSSNVSMMSPSFRSWKSDRPMPHSKPDWTSRTSSLKRRREEMAPFQITTPSRMNRTFDPRVMTPLRT